MACIMNDITSDKNTGSLTYSDCTWWIQGNAFVSMETCSVVMSTHLVQQYEAHNFYQA